MNRDEREVVSAVKRELIGRIGRERFELWFSTNVDLRADGDRLLVAATDQFLLDRVRKQFAQDIQAALAESNYTEQALFQVDEALRTAPSTHDSGNADGTPPADTHGDGEAPALLAMPAKAASISRNRAAQHGAESNQTAGHVSNRRRFERLDTFVVGSGNRIAHAAAVNAIEQPGRLSPIFIYGPTGCGKSHLLEGIWSALRSRTTHSRVLYLAAEQFTSHFLEALRGGGLPSFRRKCRGVDLLIVDDVHFFSGKRATIIELQHTVDELLRAGKQLVLAADRPPAQMIELGPELIARVSGGLICGVDEPDCATRLGITRRFTNRMRFQVPPEVAELIATEVGGDARHICGALNRLEATCMALDQPLTVGLAKTTLREVFRATQRVVRLPDIERAVCDTFGLEPTCLRDKSKAKAVSQPRMLAMWLARKHTHAAFSEISEYFGRRSHSTVISAEKKISRLVAEGSHVQLGQEAWQVQDAIRRVEFRLRTG